MNQNAHSNDDRPPAHRDVRCEPLWRYQDLAPALPAEAADDEAETRRRPDRSRRSMHAPPPNGVLLRLAE